MNRVLIDTNILLDIALARPPFFESAVKIGREIESRKIEGCVSATSIKDLYYVAYRDLGHERTMRFVRSLFTTATILCVDREIITKAADLPMRDFEDAIQVVAAKFNEVDAIVTRNIKDFLGCGLTAYAPEEFLTVLEQS